MPDVNDLTVSELWEQARYYTGAVRTDDPGNLTHNAQMLANLVERLSEQVGHFRPATSKIPWDLEDPSVEAAATLSPAALVDAANEAQALNDELNADERKAFNLIDSDERLASFAATCGSDDLELRLTDEIYRNDLDIDVDRIDFVKVMNHFQNT